MIAIKHFLKPFSLESTSHILLGFTVLIYPLTVFGAILPDGKTMVLILLFSSFALHGCSRVLTNKDIWCSPALLRPLSALTCLVFISILTAQNKARALDSFIFFTAYLCCFVQCQVMFKSERRQRYFAYALWGITVIISLSGLADYFIWSQKLEKWFRLRGPFGSYNLMAGWLVMAIPVSIGLLMSVRRNIYLRMALYASLGIMCIALLFTYCRGGWIGVVIGMLFMGGVWFVTKRHRRQSIQKIFLSFACILVVIVLFFLSNPTLVRRFNTMTQLEVTIALNGRPELATAAAALIRDYPFTGVGPGNYASEITPYMPPGMGRLHFTHNDYLQYIADVGPALIPILIWLAWIYFKNGVLKVKRAGSRVQPIVLGAMGSGVGMMVYSLGDYNLHIVANIMLFAALAALVLSPHPPSPSSRMERKRSAEGI